MDSFNSKDNLAFFSLYRHGVVVCGGAVGFGGCGVVEKCAGRLYARAVYESR